MNIPDAVFLEDDGSVKQDTITRLPGVSEEMRKFIDNQVQAVFNEALIEAYAYHILPWYHRIPMIVRCRIGRFLQHIWHLRIVDIRDYRKIDDDSAMED